MIKLFKLFIFCAIQTPISVYYYFNPTNPIPFLIWQYLITIWLFFQDNAISYNYDANQALIANWEELLKKILKPIPKQPKDSDFPEFEEE